MAMILYDVATLIAETPEAHGVYEAPEETEREVYCVVSSVKRSEAYQAMGQGLAPEIVLTLADVAEYQGEPRCRYGGKEYRIIHTYMLKSGGIELKLERSNADV